MTATLVALAVLALAPGVHQQPAPQGTYTVSGRVVDGTNGRAISGAVIVLWDRSKERASGMRFPTPTGVFDIPNVAAGLYTLAAEVPGARFSYRTETVDLEVRNANVSGLGLIITPVGPRLTTVSGRLLMEGGTPLPASIIRIRSGAESTVVQRDGSFQLQFRAEEKYPVRVEDLPQGAYIKTISAGSWNPDSEILVFSATPPPTIQVTLAIGARTVRGRVVDKAKSPAQAMLTLSMPSSPTSARQVPVNADGSFEVGQVRSGDYELRARLGSGATTQTGKLQVTVANQDRTGLEVALKEMTLQKGRIVMEGVGRLEDLHVFRPVIEVTDILGLHPIPIRTDGTFEFQSFEGDYRVAIRNLPVTYESFITVGGSSVEVKVRVVQGDIPGFRFLPPR